MLKEKENKIMGITMVLSLLSGVALFLYGMSLMGDSLKKVAGNKLELILYRLTNTPLKGLLLGTVVTAIIQSSSATTVMVVGFVNSGMMKVAQAIGIIMGANIGTTVTAWLISALGFKVDIAAFALPLLAFALPLFFSGKSSRKSIGEFVFGFAFLFMGLQSLKANAPDLGANPEMLAFVQNYTDMGFFSIILFLFIGAILTMIVQASAATMAITLIMCANGWIDYHLGVALVLGENIGTTITANLAALTGNTQARRAALAHLVFNVFGVMWVLVLFYPFTNAVSWFVTHVMKVSDPAVAVSFKLAAFHTAFNISNTFIMIWFVSLIEKTVCTLIKPKVEDEEYRLRYITGGMLSTAELSILQAHKEISLFAERTARMFNMVKELFYEKNEETFLKTYSRVEKYENISDRMEIEIANYLTEVSEGRLSSESKEEIRIMLRAVSEIESIADSCNNLARSIKRRNEFKSEFTEEQNKHLDHMFELVSGALNRMNLILHKPELVHDDINPSYNIENEINNYRNQLKSRNIEDINNKLYQYQDGVYYMDMVSESEKLGDYVLNVVQAVIEKKI